MFGACVYSNGNFNVLIGNLRGFNVSGSETRGKTHIGSVKFTIIIIGKISKI